MKPITKERLVKTLIPVFRVINGGVKLNTEEYENLTLLVDDVTQLPDPRGSGAVWFYVSEVIDHASYLLDTLVPDCRESGNNAHADDHEKSALMLMALANVTEPEPTGGSFEQHLRAIGKELDDAGVPPSTLLVVTYRDSGPTAVEVQSETAMAFYVEQVDGSLKEVYKGKV